MKSNAIDLRRVHNHEGRVVGPHPQVRVFEGKQMNSCPKCNSTLPDWAQQCQFCGTAVTPVARPTRDAGPAKSNYAFGIAKWVWVAYYSIAGYFAASGLASVIISAISIAQFNSDVPEGSALRVMGFGLFVGLGVALLGVGIGVGLLFQSDFARGFANIYCCLLALFGMWQSMLKIGLWAGLGPIDKLFGVWAILDTVSGLLMLYLIYETNDNSGF
jgi:hypothetical protein